MPTLPSQVLPGQIISSELFNAMLAEIQSLQTALGQVGSAPGTVPVPDVFGRTLSEARAIIAQPARQVTMGSVLDVTGATIDPLAQPNRLLVVLNQSPIAGTRVLPGSSVNLVVSGAAGGGPVVRPPPIITQLLTAAGTPATSFRVGEGMTISGANFDPASSNNAVSFDGVSVTPQPNAQDPTRRLFVIVPTGIPGVPTSTGGVPRDGVPITVTTSGAASATITTTIAGPATTPPPQITGITPNPAALNTNVTISGQRFSATANQNIIAFAGITATNIVSASTTQLILQIPAGIPGLNQSGSNRLVDVTVTVNGTPAVAPFQITVFVP